MWAWDHISLGPHFLLSAVPARSAEGDRAITLPSTNRYRSRPRLIVQLTKASGTIDKHKHTSEGHACVPLARPRQVPRLSVPLSAHTGWATPSASVCRGCTVGIANPSGGAADNFYARDAARRVVYTLFRDRASRDGWSRYIEPHPQSRTRRTLEGTCAPHALVPPRLEGCDNNTLFHVRLVVVAAPAACTGADAASPLPV